MKEWLSSTNGQGFSEFLRSGCAEGGVKSIVVPLPFAFVEQALTYTANKYDKNFKERWHSNIKSVPFRVSIVCDGTKMYMSFCCIDTGLVSNIYTKVENVQPFSVLIGGKTRKDALFLDVKKNALQSNINSNNDSFVLFISSEVFAIVHKKDSWRLTQGPMDELFSKGQAQRVRIDTANNVGIGIFAYSGMRPFLAVGNDKIVEYRRSKSVSINYGLTDKMLMDRIEPDTIVGTQPKHGRWLLNKASRSPTQEKGELIIHFLNKTVGFCGASPASDELSLAYDNHGAGGTRGKYQQYYNDGNDKCISIQGDSIAIKDLNSMVNNCDLMFFGVGGNKVILGWERGDVLMLWEQSIVTTTVPAMLDGMDEELKDLKCDNFVLPNVLNVFSVPEYLDGYDIENPELTENQLKTIIRTYSARRNALRMNDKRTSESERELYRKPPVVITPEAAKIYTIWFADYEVEQNIRGVQLTPEERKFFSYLTDRAK
jgi:hypothetical protein